MRTVIIAGGSITDYDWLAETINQHDRVICVDGGARHAAALGLVPDLIVGDMDSIDRKLLRRLAEQGASVKEYPAEKDDTDTALALAEALAARPDEIIILGALGSRFDHSLANVHLLQVALERGVRATIANEANEISLIAPQHPAVVSGCPGDEFSLLPLTRQVTGVNVQGARWPLRDAVFSIGNPYGISNRLMEHSAAISIATGLLLIIKTNERGD